MDKDNPPLDTVGTSSGKPPTGNVVQPPDVTFTLQAAQLLLIPVQPQPLLPLAPMLGDDIPPNPHHDTIVQGCTTKIQENSDFNPNQYSPEQLQRLTKVGAYYGIDPDTLIDLLYVGSRNKKPISADKLEEQMFFLTQVIIPRGYPFKFDNQEQFVAFSNTLIDKLNEEGVVSTNVCVQGSSLRKPDAGDVDIAVVISKEQFAAVVRGYYNGKLKTKRTTKKGEDPIIADVGTMNFDQLMGLVVSFEKETAKYVKSRFETFVYIMRAGMIHSGDSGPGEKLSNAVKVIQANFPHLKVDSVSYIISGGPFDLKPALVIKKI